MLIKLEVLEKIKSGEITLQFRRWKRRTVKAGGTLKTKVGVLQIGDITPIAAGEVTEADARRAGFRDVADFLQWLDTMKPGELDRIEVSYKGEDPREALGQDIGLGDGLIAHLKGEFLKIDRTAGRDWSRRALAAIGEREGVPAAELAGTFEQEKDAFKAKVRQLIALGLVQSLETGYRLTPRGAEVLGRL